MGLHFAITSLGSEVKGEGVLLEAQTGVLIETGEATQEKDKKVG